MAKNVRYVQKCEAPVKRAMVFICDKCGKRVGAPKHSSRELASRLKRQIKHQFTKGDLRIILTSCMDLCPEDRIAVALQPLDSAMSPTFWEVDIRDSQQSGEALSGAIIQALEMR